MPDPTTANIPVQSFTCPGCDCGMCVSTALTAINLMPGVVHARADRFKKRFVVRYEDDVVHLDEIEERITAAGIALDE